MQDANRGVLSVSGDGVHDELACAQQRQREPADGPST